MRAGSPGMRLEMVKVMTVTPKRTKIRNIKRRRMTLRKDIGAFL